MQSNDRGQSMFLKICPYSLTQAQAVEVVAYGVDGPDDYKFEVDTAVEGVGARLVVRVGIVEAVVLELVQEPGEVIYTLPAAFDLEGPGFGLVQGGEIGPQYELPVLAGCLPHQLGHGLVEAGMQLGPETAARTIERS